MHRQEAKSSTSETWTRLQDLADNADYGRGPNEVMARAFIELHGSWIASEPVLELGPAEGFGTEVLAGMGKELWCLEGSTHLAESLSRRFPEVGVVNALFEDFEPDRNFGTIAMGHVLEHVDDPLLLLAKAKEWLKPDGVILIGVPNAQSLHRQLGVNLGMLSHVQQLDEGDHRVGHQRVFNRSELRALVAQAGLLSIYEGGFWMKMAPNSALADLPADVLWQHMVLGMEYPEIAAELVMVVGRP